MFDGVGHKFTYDQRKIDYYRLWRVVLTKNFAHKLSGQARAFRNGVENLLFAVNCAEIHGNIFVPQSLETQTLQRRKVAGGDLQRQVS